MDFVWVLIFALIRSSIPSILEIQNVNLSGVTGFEFDHVYMIDGVTI